MSDQIRYLKDFIDRWVEQEFKLSFAKEKIAAAMWGLAAQDPEYWSEQSLWKLYDAAWPLGRENGT